MQFIVVIDIPDYGAFISLYYFVGHTETLWINHIYLFLKYLCVEIIALFLRINAPIDGPKYRYIYNLLTLFKSNIGLILWFYITHGM